MLTITVALGQCTWDRKSSIDQYFSVHSFIDSQISQLDSLNPKLIKTVIIDGKKENVKELNLDSAAWETEFKIFREHDINKPVLLDAYSVRQPSAQNGSQLETYRLKDVHQSGITKMDITYIRDKWIKSWQSEFNESNLLYSNFRQLNMDFNEKGGAPRLIGYSVRGYHKLLFQDTVYYQLQATLDYGY